MVRCLGSLILLGKALASPWQGLGNMVGNKIRIRTKIRIKIRIRIRR